MNYIYHKETHQLNWIFFLRFLKINMRAVNRTVFLEEGRIACDILS